VSVKKEMTSMGNPSQKAKQPGRNGFKYRPQFGVVVLCKDERHQAKVYEALQRLGYRCKVVAV
jgi:hypothetical protein